MCSCGQKSCISLENVLSAILTKCYQPVKIFVKKIYNECISMFKTTYRSSKNLIISINARNTLPPITERNRVFGRHCQGKARRKPP